MFKIASDPQFTHSVTVLVPIDGGHREDTFKARFRFVPDDEQDGLDFGNGDDLKAFFRKAWIGFEDVADEEGNVLVWSDRTRDWLLSLPYVRLALLRTYMTALTKAKAGN